MPLTEIAKGYRDQLSDEGYEFYAAAGIQPATVREFGLGWIVEPLLAQHEAFVGHPVVPYWTVRGTCVWLRVNAFAHDMLHEHDRTIIGEQFPLQVPSRHLFNVRHAMPGLRTSQVLLVEDVRSVMLARQAGWRAVAAPGFDHWHESWDHLFEASHVALVWSEDRDGPAEAVMRSLTRRGVEILPMRLPARETLGSLLGDQFPTAVDLLELVASLPLDVAPEQDTAN